MWGVLDVTTFGVPRFEESLCIQSLQYADDKFLANNILTEATTTEAMSMVNLCFS